jgi:hypothetical protein
VKDEQSDKSTEIKSVDVKSLKDMFYDIENSCDFDTGIALKMSFSPRELDKTILAFFEKEAFNS